MLEAAFAAGTRPPVLVEGRGGEMNVFDRQIDHSNFLFVRENVGSLESSFLRILLLGGTTGHRDFCWNSMALRAADTPSKVTF